MNEKENNFQKLAKRILDNSYMTDERKKRNKCNQKKTLEQSKQQVSELHLQMINII